MDSELKFEKALERLEKIVQDLEGGNIPLDEALKKYEEGVKLSRLCTQKLGEVESKVEVLTRTLGGILESAPFGGEEGSKKAGRKKEKKSQKQTGEESGLLL